MMSRDGARSHAYHHRMQKCCRATASATKTPNRTCQDKWISCGTKQVLFFKSDSAGFIIIIIIIYLPAKA